MIKWSNRFSIGDKAIDEQHRKLIDIMEEIILLINESNDGFLKIFGVVTELDDYIAEHLAYEEVLMKKRCYPEAKDHIKEHNELRKTIALLNMFEIESTDKFYKDILIYLVEWLSVHIMFTDRKLGMFLEKKEKSS